MVRKMPSAYPLLSSLLSDIGVGSQTLRAVPRLAHGAGGKVGSRPLFFERTCLCVGVSRIQLATDKLDTAASAACGARPDVCMVWIDDKVHVISRPPVLLRELADSWRRIPGFLPAQGAHWAWPFIFDKIFP